jgi:signal peptidase
MASIEHTLLISLLQKSLAAGERFYLTVRSNSMAPLLRQGDQIAVEAALAHHLEPGDIIVIDEGTDLLTHRYWGRSETEKLVTRGDRLLQFDPLWEQRQLIGRVTARRRGQRTFSLQAGSGGWLAGHLWRVALLEEQMVAGFPEVPLASGGRSAFAGQRLENRQREPLRRLLRLALRAWAEGMAAVCTLVMLTRGQERTG